MHAILPTMTAPTFARDCDQETELEIKSILLLDDDFELADTLKLLLESRNYVVTTVHNGVDGLQEVMALDFDVIVCDMLMPRMAGDMFYRAVKQTKPHLCERFIFVTAHADNPKVEEFMRATGCVGLMKPVSTDDLVRAIAMVLKKTRVPVAD